MSVYSSCDLRIATCGMRSEGAVVIDPLARWCCGCVCVRCQQIRASRHVFSRPRSSRLGRFLFFHVFELEEPAQRRFEIEAAWRTRLRRLQCRVHRIRAHLSWLHSISRALGGSQRRHVADGEFDRAHSCLCCLHPSEATSNSVHSKPTHAQRRASISGRIQIDCERVGAT